MDARHSAGIAKIRNSRSRLRSAATLLSVAVGFTTIAGCSNVVQTENRGTDNDFLHEPDQKPDTNAVPMLEGSAFPLTPGDHWVLTVQNGDKTSEEEMVVAAPGSVPGVTLSNPSDAIVEMKHNGKVDRIEIYRSNSQGLWLLKAGHPGNLMTVNPPIPLFRRPIVEGDTVPWRGVLNFENANAPGTALSRVSGRVTVSTPNGNFGAYRLDTIIDTSSRGQALSLPVTRWIAPGVGLVQQKLLSGKTVVVKSLKSHRVAPSKEP